MNSLYLTEFSYLTHPRPLKLFSFSCDLSKAHCKDNSLHRRYKGPCPVDSVTTTTSKPISGGGTHPTQAPINGSEIAFDIFCLDLFHHDCSNEMAQPLCASNGKTYQNL